MLTMLVDACAIFLAFLLSYYIRFDFAPFNDLFPVTKGKPEPVGYMEFALLIIPIWLLVFQSRKMYRIRRNVFVLDELFIIIKCVTIGMLFAMGLVFLLKGDFPYSRLVFALIWFNSIILITIGRYITLKFEKNLYNKGIGLNRAALLGTNEMAENIYERFSKDKFTGYDVLGYFDYENSGENHISGKSRLGSLNDIPNKIKELRIDKIFISIPSSRHDVLEELLRLCEGINI